MPSCERCWSDAYMRAMGSFHKGQAEHYRELVEERNCTPEDQAGPDAGECYECERMTMHQHCHVCMACGYDPDKTTAPEGATKGDDR